MTKAETLTLAISSAVYRIGEAADRADWLALDLTEVRAITAHFACPQTVPAIALRSPMTRPGREPTSKNGSTPS